MRLITLSRRNWLLLTWAALFATIGLWLSITVRELSWDEPWMLQVVSRMQSGETLYRDIFYGATPLGAYLTLGMTQLLGRELWVVKFTTVLSCFCALLVSIRIIRRLTDARNYDIFFAAAMLLYGLPLASAIYQTLANLFLLICFDVILRWNENWREATPAVWRIFALPVLVGASAGLCFATKQSVGVYALAASLALLLLQRGELEKVARAQAVQSDHLSKISLLTCVLFALIGFTLVVSVMLLPIILSGGIEKFLDYGFVNKRTYLEAAGVSYFEGVRRFLSFYSVRPRILMATEFFESQIFLLIPIALFGLLLAFVLGEKNQLRRSLLVACLVVAEMLSIYPRADLIHVVFAVPGFLIAAIYSWHLWKMRMAAGLAALLQTAFWLLVLGGISLKLMVSYRGVTSTEYIWSDLPHLRYKLLRADEQAKIRNHAEWLARNTAGEPTYILSPDASLYYLVSGLKNPTPFDFPLMTAFGTHGLKEVMTAVDERRIRAICMRKIDWPLAPVELEKYVESKFRFEAKGGSCDLYRMEK